MIMVILPLCLVCMGGCKETVQVLLNNNAQVNYQNNIGKTALTYAKMKRRYFDQAIITMLEAAGAVDPKQELKEK
jgi:ankyrin repeat protein